MSECFDCAELKDSLVVLSDVLLMVDSSLVVAMLILISSFKWPWISVSGMSLLF